MKYHLTPAPYFAVLPLCFCGHPEEGEGFSGSLILFFTLIFSPIFLVINHSKLKKVRGAKRRGDYINQLAKSLRLEKRLCSGILVFKPLM